MPLPKPSALPEGATPADAAVLSLTQTLNLIERGYRDAEDQLVLNRRQIEPVKRVIWEGTFFTGRKDGALRPVWCRLIGQAFCPAPAPTCRTWSCRSSSRGRGGRGRRPATRARRRRAATRSRTTSDRRACVQLTQPESACRLSLLAAVDLCSTTVHAEPCPTCFRSGAQRGCSHRCCNHGRTGPRSVRSAPPVRRPRSRLSLCDPAERAERHSAICRLSCQRVHSPDRPRAAPTSLSSPATAWPRRRSQRFRGLLALRGRPRSCALSALVADQLPLACECKRSTAVQSCDLKPSPACSRRRSARS